MDNLFDQEILNTAFINDAYLNLKRSRVLLKVTKSKIRKAIGKFGSSKQTKSPSRKRLNGVFQTMTKHSSPVKRSKSPELNLDDGLIDYSVWIQNLNTNISKLEYYGEMNRDKFEFVDTKQDNDAMEIEVLEDLMKKICAINK